MLAPKEVFLVIMFACPRYRLQPTLDQERVLLRHCQDARYRWNHAVEQHSWWRPGRKSAHGYLEQSRQLTGARAESPWLREGSQMVRQQALRDFGQAMQDFFNGTHRIGVAWEYAHSELLIAHESSLTSA